MADESTFRALLTGHPALVALVPATRIWNNRVPTNTPTPVTTPYILLSVIVSTAENYVGEAPDADLIRIQVDIVATTKSALKSVLAAIRAAVVTEAYEVMAADGQVDDPSLRRLIVDYEYWATR